MNAPRGSTATPEGERTHPKERWQRFSPNKSRRYPPHRSLSPAHQTLPLRSAPEIRPSGAPRTQGDDVRTVWSSAANLTHRQHQHTLVGVHHCLADADFRRRLQELRRDMVQRTSGMLMAAAAEAVKTLRALLKKEEPEAVWLGRRGRSWSWASRSATGPTGPSGWRRWRPNRDGQRRHFRCGSGPGSQTPGSGNSRTVGLTPRGKERRPGGGGHASAAHEGRPATVPGGPTRRQRPAAATGDGVLRPSAGRCN
jgi:hypothetical protein